MTEHTDRVAVANDVIKAFAAAHIERRHGGWYVCWNRHDGSSVAKRWLTRGQSFYPPWSRQYPGGGTSITAVSQLIRWCGDKPVLPISTWRYWASETVKLLPLEAVETLLAGGYPEHVPCVLCGEIITGGLDWWALDKVSGPCCGWTSGCRQKQTA